MLNLRQLNKTDNTENNSDAQHFSRFSIDFRVPSDLLGNIGEPLDHSQSERPHEDGSDECEVVADESEANAGADLESAEPVAGSSGARLEEEDRAPAGTAGIAAGSSVTRWDDNGRSRLDDTVPSAWTSGTQGDEAGDTSHAPGFVDGADTRVNDLTEDVRLFLSLYCCGPRLRAIFFAGAGDQH